VLFRSQIDPASLLPARVQVIDQIKNLIDSGAILPGTPLPSSRKLADTLGISRSTVYIAYEELQAMGYLKSRPGSYNVVQRRQSEVEIDASRKSSISWKSSAVPPAAALHRLSGRIAQDYVPSDTSEPEKLISLGKLDADVEHFPLREFKRSMNYVLQNMGPTILSYGTPKGYAPLREYIAHRSRLHGISVSADDVLITSGAQHAIDLVLRLLVRPGATVVTEVPTYGVILPLLRLFDANVVGVPMKDDGMDLAALERVLKKGSVALVYVMPNFQNPTGITTTHQHRERLLSLCTTYGVPLVEDGFEEDLKYYGKVDLPIKSMDGRGVVIYIGSFSKALFPGIRMGWIIADRECIELLTSIRRFADLGTSKLLQVVMHHFCSSGYYDHHLKRLHRRFQRRMEHTLRVMRRVMPKGCSWTKPAGGYTIWVRTPVTLDAASVERVFRARGVTVAPGWYFFPGARSSEYFRISISAASEKEITEGISLIAQGIRSLTLTPVRE
jgi:DNA-binding transcriptional MocR family regulator